MKPFLLLLLIIPLSAPAQTLDKLSLPESSRSLGMGGAMIALCDDPQAGYLNPAGLRMMKQIGYEMSYDGSTRHTPDHFSISLANPGSDQGNAFAMGGWTQGLTEQRRQKYYVPWTGTCWGITKRTYLGVVTRFPYLKSEVDSIRSRWETLADVTAVQAFQSFHIGASVERAFGGGKAIVPRRVHVGAAIVSESGFVASYEYRANETRRTYDFHFSTSRIGAEAVIGRYMAFRAGYITGDINRIAAGAAIGLLKSGGWRFESSFELPTSGRGYTRWAVGMGYRT